MLSVFFTDDEVPDYAAAQAAATWRFPAFFHALLERGVYPPPSAFEAWFVSAALDDDAGRSSRTRCPPRPGPPPRPRRRPRPASESGTGAPSCTCCGTARCTTPTASSTAGCPGSGCPRTARRQAEIVAKCAGRRRPRRRARLADAARAGDRGTDRGGARPGDRHRRAADRGGQPVRGRAGVGRRRGAAQPAVLAAAPRPVHPVLGRAVPADRAPDARRRAPGPRAGRRPRGGVRVAPAADLDAAPVRHRPAALARPAAPAVRARLAHLAGVHRHGADGLHYSEPAGRERSAQTGA